MKKEDEIIITTILIITIIFSFLSVSQEAGVVLFMMVMGYFVALGSRQLEEVEIIRSEKKARDPVKILWVIGAITCIWIVSNSIIYGLSQGEFTLFSANMFKAVYLHSNIPILSNDPFVIQIVWGFIFPIVESLFFLSVVLLLYNRFIFRSWKLPKIINRHNILKVAWVACLVGATASLLHLQVRQAESWALLGDFIFFSLSTVVVYKVRQMLESAGVHSIINNLVLALGGA